MKVISLEVKACIRFSLHPHLDHFVFRPDNNISIILGGNGSGKSTLLSYLTGYPPSISDFKKGGYSRLQIDHNKHQYILTVGNQKPAFSFLVDGEEENPTHRITNQIRLAEEHFGMTKDTHELITDQITFTQMSTAVRKKWFINLSAVDYDYALSIYQKVLNSRKAAKAIHDHTRKKLSVAVGEDIHIDSTVLKDEIKAHYTELDTLMADKVHVTDSEVEIAQNLQECSTQLSQQTDLLHRLERADEKTTQGLGNVDPVEAIQFHDKSIATLLAKEDLLKDSLLELNNEIDKDVEGTSLVELENEREQLRSRLKNTPLSLGDPEKAHTAINSISGVLGGIASDIPVYDATVHNTACHQTDVDRFNELTGMLCSSENQLADLLKDIRALEYAKQNDQVTCPKCSHLFKHGFDPEVYGRLKKEAVTLTTSTNTYQEEHDLLSKRIDDYQVWHSCHVQYDTLSKQYPELSFLWDLIDINHPDRIANQLSSSVAFVDSKLADQQVMTLIAEVDDKIAIYTKFDKQAHQVIKDKIHRAEEKLVHLINRRRQFTEWKEEYVIIVEARREMGIVKSLLLTLTEEQVRLRALLRLIKEQNSLLEKIQLLRIKITNKEHQLSKIDIQHDTLMRLEDETQRLFKEYELLALSVKSLSPTSGFLADSLIPFITSFVDNMNQYLAYLWSYPLVIGVPVPEDGQVDLSYRFKLTVGDNKPVSDITKGSRGMIDMINLAFKLTVLNSLGMSGYPVLLDELGASFDIKHRDKLVDYIKRLLVKLNASNIFIVSHYAELYNVFGNADTDYTLLTKEGVDTTMIDTGRSDCLAILGGTHG